MGIQVINKSSTTIGTPVPIYTPDATHPVLSGSGLQIQADPSNGGKVYIGLKGMVKGSTPATRVNVLAVLVAGDQWPQGPEMGGVNPEFIYLDVDTSGDGVNVGIAG